MMLIFSIVHNFLILVFNFSHFIETFTNHSECNKINKYYSFMHMEEIYELSIQRARENLKRTKKRRKF